MLVLLSTVFCLILALTLTIVMVATNPTRETKLIEQRITAVATHSPIGGQASVEALQLLRKTATSRFGWIDKSLTEYKPAARIARYISQSGAKTTPAAVLVQAIVLAAAGYGIAFVINNWFLIDGAAAVLLGMLPWLRIVWMRSRRMRAFDTSLAHGIDMMARALRAGHSIAGSIEIVSQGSPEPAASEFGEVFRQQNFGMPLRDAMMQMLDRVPSQDLRVLVTAILVQRETGGNLVEILDRTVQVIRERQRIHGEIRTQTAQGRLTGWILTSLPVVMLILINFVDPGYSKVLFTDPTGRDLIYAGVVFIAIGAFWIRRIINRIEV